MAKESGITRIAVCQIEPVFGEVQRNADTTLEAIAAAAAAGADAVVLPELASTGYMFANRAEAFELSQEAGRHAVTGQWLRAAAEHQLIVVGGFAERDGDVLYNAAFLARPDGRWSVYRKVHLWDEEALYFEPGNLGFPVVDLPFGRVGMMICYDGWFPEAYRALADSGADLVCVPTNWVPLEGHPDGQPAMATVLVRAAAHVNGLVVAAADRVGRERGQDFIGQSVIVSHTGLVLAGPASSTEPALLWADVNLGETRRSRGWGRFNHLLADRRPDAYGPSRA
ncbi:MAG: hypothetical protein LBS27_06450 [Bifidobacteriaceae bacterium]|jgi:predicted amidohydrolase|nr:hypothetical protein [Bifidobacteriaceae bacterium]